ncbi:MAG TPA: DNA polymerase IV, partial [Erythrobacter sp.]|nr:DNA polymerase IV [Erythrobacter sp.]
LEDIIDIVWTSIERAEARGRTVTLKLKYTDFQIFSRAKTVDVAIAEKAQFAALARALLEEVLPLPMPIR